MTVALDPAGTGARVAGASTVDAPPVLRSFARAGIGPADRDRIVGGLVRTMPSFGVASYFDAKGRMLATSDAVVTAEDAVTGEVAALLCADWSAVSQGPFLEIRTLLIGEAYHRSTLIRRLWRRLFEDLIDRGDGFPPVIVLKTYNPKSYAAMAPFGRIRGADLYPALRGAAFPGRRLAHVEAIARAVSPDCRFDPDTGIVHGGAGAVDAFYGGMPTTGKAWLDAYFARHLTARDRLLCCLFVDTPAAVAEILRIFGVAGRRRRASA